MAKQSKYSPRRPANQKPQYPDKKKVQKPSNPFQTSSWPSEGLRGVKKAPAVIPKELDNYELGIFLDDKREMSQVSLPKADKWLVVRNHREFSDLMVEVFGTGENVPTTIFVSFDHYLHDDPRFPTGKDCLFELMEYRDDEKYRIDIQGHSSDGVMNDDKVDFWYRDCKLE